MNKNSKLKQMMDTAKLSVKLIKFLQDYEKEAPKLKKFAVNLQKKLAKRHNATFIVTRDINDEGGFVYDTEPEDVKIKIFGKTENLFDSIVEFTNAKYLGKNLSLVKNYANTADVLKIPDTKIFMLLQTKNLILEENKTAEIRFTNWINGELVVVKMKK